MCEVISESGIHRGIINSDNVGDRIRRAQSERHGSLGPPEYERQVDRLALARMHATDAKELETSHGMSNDCRIGEAVIFDER